MMYKSVLLATLLVAVSFNATATPRTLLPSESKIEFIVKEMGVPVSGEFKRFTSDIDIDPFKPEKSHANLSIEVGTLDTGSDEADKIAIDPDWLDKVHAPLAIFKSQTIRALGGERFESKGTLSIRNKVRDIVIQFNATNQPSGKTVIVSNFIIKRTEYGIGGGIWNQAGVVAEEIPVKVTLTLAPPAPPAKAAAKPAKKK